MKGRATHPKFTMDDVLRHASRAKVALPDEILDGTGFDPSGVKKVLAKPVVSIHAASPAKKRKPSTAEIQYKLILDREKREGRIIDFEEQAIKLSVGEPLCWYLADFAVWKLDGTLLLIEVKGDSMIWEDAVVKWKSAQRQYPHIEFQFWLLHTKTGEWERRYN